MCYPKGVLFMKMNKVLTSSLVIMMALGLAGCASNNAAPATKVNHPTSAKVTKATSHKASSQSSASQKTSQATTSTNYAANTANAQQVVQPSHQTASSQQAPVSQQQKTSSATQTSDEAVLNGFFKASGVQQNRNDQYLVTKNGNNYQIEIRTNNDDNTVSNLNGLYQYNPSNNSVQKMNVVTGDYE